MKKCSYCGAEYPDDATVCATDQTPLDSPSPEALSAKEPHSLLGIASFCISLAVGLLMLMAVVAAGILNQHRIPGERTYPGQMLVGFALIFLMAGDVVALSLGIAAVCQKARNRLFGILGMAFSGLTLMGAVGLMILGIIYASRFAR